MSAEQEPHTRTLHTRRKFLRTSLLGAAASWTLPLFLERTFGVLDAQAADSPIQTATGKDSPILVVLQMAGGNDGLNTVVPFTNDAYFKARPALAIRADQSLKLNDSVGLHPSLAGLKGLYDRGELAILQGVGYPNPNRSHFRATEIWQTASDAEKTLNKGWLGRYFDSCCKGADPTVGVSVGGEMPLAFAAENPTGVSFEKPEQFRWYKSGTEDERIYRSLNRPEALHPMESDNEGASIAMLAGGRRSSEGNLDFLQRTGLDAQLSSEKVQAIAQKYRSTVSYPNSRIADSLSLVGRMIAGGLQTRVYYVSQGGYDTHSNQLGTQERLLAELSQALSAFCEDLKAQGNFQRVMLMTFSEFGRRVAQNGSAGTDHGAAGPLFVLGGGVKPGIFGAHPSLTDLHNGDLKYNVDFRSVYATLLERWLHAPSRVVLGKQFPLLPIIG